MPDIAQRRLVLTAADPAHGGGGAFQGEALAPGTGPRRRGPHQIVQRIQRGAGEKGGFGNRGDRSARRRPAGHNWRRSDKSEVFGESNHLAEDTRAVRFALP